jgi:hypothetical protein
VFSRRSRAAFATLALVACVAGCSGPSGVLGTIAAPKGNITIASYPGGATLDTSSTNPYVVDDTFSISISETNYGGPYTITPYSWSNGFNEPCFVPHTVSAAIYTFSPDHANPASDPKTTPNPCKASDVETELINDGKGHNVYFSFKLSAALTGGAAPTPTPLPSGETGTPCSQGDPNYSSIAITGSFQQFNFPACNDFTITATLPANSGAGEALEIGTSSATQFGDSLTATNGTPLISIAFEPSPSSFSLSDTTQSLTVGMTSPSKLGGGTYTMELRENNAIIETIPNITPSSDEIFFNAYPLSGMFDLSNYVAIVYKN